MEQAARIQIIKGFYKAYAEADRAFIESVISNDFTFSSPPDLLLTYETYFERC